MIMALVDMDILVYRIGFACQKTRYTVGSIDLGTKKTEAKRLAIQKGFKIDDIEGTLEIDPVEYALHLVNKAMIDILYETKATHYRGFLTGKGNFRETLVDYYKMNRKDAAKPHYYDAIRKHLEHKWHAEMQLGQEADDALSIAQWDEYTSNENYRPSDRITPGGASLDTIIVTIDKDLLNTPGWNYNFVTKVRQFVTEEQATLNFYVQLITGDMTDNIPGLYQITGVRNNKKFTDPLAYMEDIKEMWEYVVSVYVKAFEPYMATTPWWEHQDVQQAVKDKLRETGQLLWMRRYEGEMWEAPE